MFVNVYYNCAYYLRQGILWSLFVCLFVCLFVKLYLVVISRKLHDSPASPSSHPGPGRTWLSTKLAIKQRRVCTHSTMVVTWHTFTFTADLSPLIGHKITEPLSLTDAVVLYSQLCLSAASDLVHNGGFFSAFLDILKVKNMTLK